MLDWFFHPRVFNVAIMAMYTLAILWWAAHDRWIESLYWFFALGITATVTFGYQR